MQDNLLKRLTNGRLVPVIRSKSAEDAERVVDALVAGEITTIEITMTVPGAIDVLKRIADKYGQQILLGAGTVLDDHTARAVIQAGAEFVVSPHLDKDTIHATKEAGKLAIPGALTPTEIWRAIEYGADIVKVFPCGEIGGARYIKALKGPFPHVKMIAAGGVRLENVNDFIQAGVEAVCVGGNLVGQGSPVEITARARDFVRALSRYKQSDVSGTSGPVTTVSQSRP